MIFTRTINEVGRYETPLATATADSIEALHLTPETLIEALRAAGVGGSLTGKDPDTSLPARHVEVAILLEGCAVERQFFAVVNGRAREVERDAKRLELLSATAHRPGRDEPVNWARALSTVLVELDPWGKPEAWLLAWIPSRHHRSFHRVDDPPALLSRSAAGPWVEKSPVIRQHTGGTQWTEELIEVDSLDRLDEGCFVWLDPTGDSRLHDAISSRVAEAEAQHCARTEPKEPREAAFLRAHAAQHRAQRDGTSEETTAATEDLLHALGLR